MYVHAHVQRSIELSTLITPIVVRPLSMRVVGMIGISSGHCQIANSMIIIISSVIVERI